MQLEIRGVVRPQVVKREVLRQCPGLSRCDLQAGKSQLERLCGVRIIVWRLAFALEFIDREALLAINLLLQNVLD